MAEHLPDCEEFLLRDGRYLGNDGRWYVEVRVDTTVSGVVSADLRTAGTESPELSCSVRTVPGARIESPVGRWETEWVSAEGRKTGGWLELEPVRGTAGGLTIRLCCAGELDRLPPGTVVTASAQWAGPELRQIGVETEIEDGVGEIRPARFNDSDVDFRDCLRRAGFSVHEAGMTTTIPRAHGGWHESNIFSELNALMARTAQAGLDTPAWELHLLLLSRTRRDGLFGLMFDDVHGLPRQGAAVFVDEIRTHFPDDHDSKIVQAIVHELGHGLNLTHRFSREVRRSNSTSFMNYDWRYRGGRHAEEYWEKFAYTFDDDELEFLRHAPRTQIIPGGNPFGSAPYWSGSMGSQPRTVPEESGLRLWLTPPRAGTTFAFGQPIFLEVSLQNVGDKPVMLPRHVLDVKSGQLEILLRRRDKQQAADRAGLADATAFTPIMRRCYGVTATGCIMLRRGESLHDNVNLAYGSGSVPFGSDGFPFAEPGEYEVIPALTFPAADDAVFDRVVQGAPLRIQVSAPEGAELRDADTLLRSDVGVWLALGGAAPLGPAGDALREVKARREHEGRVGPDDPVVAAIARAAGIEAGRNGDRETAVHLLGQATTPAALASFDPHTAEHTRRLSARYAAPEAPSPGPALVVVDLKARPRTGGAVQGGRVAGIMITDGTRQGWQVLAPADQLPAGPEQLEAAVMTAGEDGLSERVSVQRVDLIVAQRPSDHPPMALLWLARAIPTPPLTTQLDHSAGTRDRDLWEVLARQGVTPPGLESLRGQALAEHSEAVDLALDGAAGSADLAPPATEVAVVPDFDDLASVICRWTPLCLPGRPPSSLEPPYPPDPRDTPCNGSSPHGATTRDSG